MNRKTITPVLLLAALILFSLCTCACVNAPVPQVPVPTVPPVVSPTVTPGAANVSTTGGTVPPPAMICNCPMEPVVSVTLTPTATPDGGPCHCP